MSVIITHCDINFLSRSIALIVSIRETSGERQVWVYTHDSESHAILSSADFPNVKIIRSEILTNEFNELAECKKSKSKMEFIFAMTPFMILHASRHTKRDVWYIDADIYFFQSIDNLETQTNAHSLMVSAHNFPIRLIELEKYGKYNVGIIYISGDEESIKTIEWWARKCLEDTSLFFKENVYGDQKYLDEFPKKNSRFGVFSPLESCAAPWNVELSNSVPPITYHFSGLRRYKHFTVMGLYMYGVRRKRNIRGAIYCKYINKLDKIEKEIFGNLKVDLRKLPSKLLLKAIFMNDILFRWEI